MAAVVALLATGCAGGGAVPTPLAGDDGPAPAVAVSGCGRTAPADRSGTVVEVLWGGAWDERDGPALLERWDDSDDEVDVLVADAPSPSAAARELLGDDPPTIAKVPADMVPVLAHAGAIAPLGPCVESAPAPGEPSGRPADPLREAAMELGTYGDARWGVPVGVDTLVLLRDRALLRSAGVDPDRPPATLAELHEQAAAVRAAEGTEHPVAGFGPDEVAVGAGLGTAPTAAAEQYVEMAHDGLLVRSDRIAGPSRRDEPLPVGSGGSAFAVVNVSQLWGYANALAEGQARGVDLAVSALPGETGAASPVLGDVWVMSSSATEAQSSAAGALVDWLAADEQQAALVPLTDVLPLSTGAADLPVTAPHWERLPLVRAAQRLVAAQPAAVAPWRQVPGAPPTMAHLLGAAAFDGRPLSEAWVLVQRALYERRWLEGPDRAAAYARCLLSADLGRASIADCAPL
ncbi:ABC transporter substrate-binding protein [Dermatobacter hominis]|uniref:ABC transporter substrate-binding protein n=1 Tax=Dermatobacter hominis TaxID=2884263 RepID=UPI001D105BE0|nr:extracellular solute-binding protein [Dermatobacter hominis]UDY37966.1 extracellular solute-binding protein [Dermatobacter hominis]